MKALYSIIDNTLYQIDQIPHTPFNIARNMENSSTLAYDEGRHRVSVQVWLDSFDKTDVKTNKALYYEMLEALKENGITEVITIQNKFKMTIDYSLFTKSGKELDHSITVQTIEPIDSLLPLGVAKNNELVYRFVKLFKKKIDFRFKDSIPYGIMKKPFDRYILKINNICIYQDTNTEDEIHNSLEERPYRYGSHTVSSCLEFTKLVFSSQEAGVEYYPIELSYIPRVIDFDMQIMLDNYIVAFDDNEVNKILTENEKIESGYMDNLDPVTGDEEEETEPPVTYPMQDTNPDEEEETDFVIDPGPELNDNYQVDKKPERPTRPERPNRPHRPPHHRPPHRPEKPDEEIDHSDHKHYIDDWGDEICPEEADKNWRPPCPPPHRPGDDHHHHHHHDCDCDHHHHDCDCDHDHCDRPPHKPDKPCKPERPNRPHRPPHHRPGPEGPLPGEDDERPKPPERGYHYVKSSFDKKNSLLVVDNDYPDNLFMKNAMVRQKEVIKDIPNITIGEYVIRVRDCERPPEDHRPPHHRPDCDCDHRPPHRPPHKPDKPCRPERPPHKPPHKPPHHHDDCDCDCDNYVPIGPKFIKSLFDDE